MLETIRQLETISRQLEPDHSQRKQWLDLTLANAAAFLDELPTAPAYYPNPDLARSLNESPIGETGIKMETALTLFENSVVNQGLNPASARYLAYIPGGGLFPSALADFLAAISNRYAGMFFACPGAVRMENMVLRWMADVVGYPQEAAGYLASGGSIANLTAVIAARDAFEVHAGQVPRAVIYMTHQAHHCLHKAFWMAGVGQAQVRQIATDAAFRLEPGALEAAIRADQQAGLRPWLIIASAGTTNSGAVDPLAVIAEIAQKYKLWYHVDGAYGALFALCPEGQAVLNGLEQSDSVVMDPHKTLFLPYGTGALLVKDRQRLYNSHRVDADYLKKFVEADDEVSPAEVSPELTKHFRGLRLWLPLQLFGVAPFRAALSEKIYLARYFYERLRQLPGFEVGPYPDLSVVTYRFIPSRGDADAFNERLLQAVQMDGRVFISGTRLNGKMTLRLAVLSFRTHLEDIDLALQILKEKAAELGAV